MGERRTFLADQAQRLWRGIGDVAGDLALLDLFGAEAEGGWVCVSGLGFETVPVDGAAVEARRCSGLETAAAQAKALQGFAEQDGRRFAAASCGIVFLATVNEAVEEGSGGDDDCACVNDAGCHGVLFR